MSPRRIKKTRPRRATAIKRPFYIGSPSMIPHIKVDPASHVQSWAKETLEEATAEAASRLEKDRSIDEVLIVKVVRVVKRQATPIVVEDVK